MLILVLIVAEACGLKETGDSVLRPTTTAPRPTPFPWIAATARPTPEPTASPRPQPTGIRSCLASELSGSFTGEQGATGWWTRGFVIGTSSSSACLIEGPVRATYLDANGTEIVASSVENVALSSRWVVLAPSTAPSGDVVRDGQARLVLATYGDCGQAPPLHAVVLTFAPPTGNVAVDMQPAAVRGRCDAPGGKLGLVIFFALDRLPPATPLPPALAASIDAPADARSGAPLRFIVRLRNISPDIYRWPAGCPLYLEGLSGREVDPTDRPSRFVTESPPRWVGTANEIHPLNCAEAGQIIPGAEVSFEMWIAVPPDASGPNTLFWRLEGLSFATAAGASRAINVAK